MQDIILYGVIPAGLGLLWYLTREAKELKYSDLIREIEERYRDPEYGNSDDYRVNTEKIASIGLANAIHDLITEVRNRAEKELAMGPKGFCKACAREAENHLIERYASAHGKKEEIDALLSLSKEIEAHRPITELQFTDTSSRYNLGVLYLNGEEVPHDEEKATQLFQLAADQGHAEAQCNLGILYAQGKGVAQDYEKAIALFKQSIARGCAKAQFNLGAMYMNGQGVEKDYSKAEKLFLDAAEKEYIFALCNLGFMYYTGEGVKQNDRKAYKYWSLAAAQGYKQAQVKLDILCTQRPWVCESGR